MSESSESERVGGRREFLLSAAAAGGVGLLGAAPLEKEAAINGQGDDQNPVLPIRASSPFGTFAQNLGPLAELAGTWAGGGFNLISLPDFHDQKPFRLQLNATQELLQFTPIGGPVANRGSGQDDVFLFGLTYIQRVSDAVSNGALHIEPGIWLHVPATAVPSGVESVVRQSTIPHGDALIAQGGVIPVVAGGPIINPVDSTPTRNPAGAPLSSNYLAPFDNPTLPPGFKQAYVKNPNQALLDAIQGQNIVQTVVLIVSTDPNGGIKNIPFVVQNANATKLDAIFWIETVQRPDGSQFMQLQYTQTVILNFLGIDWPHISVATLVKQ